MKKFSGFNPKGFMRSKNIRNHFETTRPNVEIKITESEERVKELNEKSGSMLPCLQQQIL